MASDLTSKSSSEPRTDAEGKMLAPEQHRVNKPEGTEVATFAAGCFWVSTPCSENSRASFPSSRDIPAGPWRTPLTKRSARVRRGHAEACQIVYDPAKVTFTDLLEVFWKIHDPKRPTARAMASVRNIAPRFSTTMTTRGRWRKSANEN